MKELIEKRNDLITRAEEVLNLAKTEKRELSDAEVAELGDIKANVDRIRETLAYDDEFSKMDMMPEATKEETKVEERQVNQEQLDREAFDAYLRGRKMEERAEMTITDNGALIPTTIVNYIIRKVYDICPILDRSQKFNVKGQIVVPFYPKDSNKITVAYANEFSALTSSSGKTDSVSLGGFLAGALTKVSRSLINNSNFDIVGFVVDEMAYAIKRFIEGELLNGTSQKIEGLSTLSNSLTAASASAITADELIQLHDMVKDDFQENAIWIMSPSTRTACRLLKDAKDRYLLQDDISLPFGVSILGKPVYVSDHMPDIATGETVIYYGDMRGLATKFSENVTIDVLREKFADEHAVGVVGWLEFDGKVINEQMIAKLVMA